MIVKWRLVLFIVPDGRVAEVNVYERPPLLTGPPGGLAVVVHGPSSAGKTILMRAMLRNSRSPWVMFDEPFLGEVEPRYLIWPDAAPFLHDGFLAGIAALARTGNRVILASGGLSHDRVATAFTGVPISYVALDCDKDVLLGRQGTRSDRRGGLVEATLGAHEGWRYDIRLDSTAASPDDLARRLLALLGEPAPDTD